MAVIIYVQVLLAKNYPFVLVSLGVVQDDEVHIIGLMDEGNLYNRIGNLLLQVVKVIKICKGAPKVDVGLVDTV